MSHPIPNLSSSFPQPQLQTPMPTMAYYAPPPPAPAPAEIAPPQIPTSYQPPVSLPAQTQAPANSSQQREQQMQKNRLQELTHKLNIPLPVYQTANEGVQHAPKFRSTVLVDGVKFTSPNTFSTRKAAEKDVAELALKHISQKKMDQEFPQGSPQDFPLIQEDTVFCKSILNEFSTKMNMEMPAYNTIKAEGLLPVFISSLVFNGVSYTGSTGKNKKEAEQLAARAVILSLIGDSAMGKVLCDIIKSKVKLYAALHKVNNATSTAPLVMNSTQSLEVHGKDVGAKVYAPPLVMNSTKSLEVHGEDVGAKVYAPHLVMNSIKSLEVHGEDVGAKVFAPPLVMNSTKSLEVHGEDFGAKVYAPPLMMNSTRSLKDVGAKVYAPSTDNAPIMAGSLPTVLNISANHAVPIGDAQPRHNFNIPKLESSSEATNLPAPASQATTLPIEFVHPSSALCENAGPISSKKRRKNKKKANKRLCTDAQLPMADLPLNQAPPCSVAQ